MVVLDQVRAVQPLDAPVRLIERFLRQVWIKPCQRLSHSLWQDGLLVRLTLREQAVIRDVRSVLDFVAELREVPQR